MLCGGAGTRLRPITYTRAKQLVPVANKPILFYGLEAIASAGIKEVGIVVGDTAAEVKTAVGDGSSWDLQVTYLQQEAPLGLAHAVLIAREFLGNDDFVMYLGDNLLQQDLGDFVGRFEARRSRATAPRLLDEEGLLPASADPVGRGGGPSAVRSGGTRRLGPGAPAGGEAGRAAFELRPGRGLPLRPPDPRGGEPPSSPRAEVSSRSPTPSSG